MALSVLSFADLPDTEGFRNWLCEPWRVLQDGTQLYAPRARGLPILIDLTEGEDVWLRAKPGVDYLNQLRKHHVSSETVACKVLLELPPTIAADVRHLDKRIMEVAMNPEDMKTTTGMNWMPMLRTETDMMVNLVLQGSDALTKLTFIKGDGTVQQGEGLDFFKTQLGEDKIEDFSCKVWAEMQFIDEQKEMHRKTVAVKVHSIALAKTPKEEVVSFTQDHIERFVRAAKRIRVNRL
jgi:hypothetical protein